jgi:uncharacterized protein (DUF305 family)
MNPILPAACLTLAVAGIAGAQDNNEVELPQKCKQAIEEAMPGMGQMGNMEMPMMEQMQQMHGMPASRMEHMKAMHAAMRPMMRAMMIKDPDLAFACAMIPHHQSAIDMAKVQIETGKDEELKDLSEKLIDNQMSEIEDLKEAVERSGE